MPVALRYAPVERQLRYMFMVHWLISAAIPGIDDSAFDPLVRALYPTSAVSHRQQRNVIMMSRYLRNASLTCSCICDSRLDPRIVAGFASPAFLH